MANKKSKTSKTKKTKKTSSKSTTKKTSKTKGKKSKNTSFDAGDVGIVVIEDDIKIDKKAELEARKLYLEEAFNQYLAIATRAGNGSIAFIKQINGGSLNTQLESLGGRDPAFDWQNDGTNRLAVVARGDTFTIFTNGTQVQEFTATEFDRGFVAMVALSESGRTVCEFNNTWLWLIE